MASITDVLHPGLRIKAEVIPAGMSVTKAASQMGVGRPALSNLLNGKAALSAEMAARLEKAFKYPLRDLMEMQSQYEAAQASRKTAPASAKTYVPPFLAIKANALEDWVTHNIQARSRLAVFLRTLVHSTGIGLTKVDFPGNDDAERPGWDGFVEAGEGTPWIPEGCSGWEFGTNDDPRAKANGDFDKSVKALSKADCAEMTFIFVTPRRWAGKGAWVDSKQALKLWKDVRAYDASDIEQWLEQSLPGQAWFANETNIPAQEVRSLDKCWTDWAEVSTPPLVGSLFESAIESAKRAVASYLSSPPDKPLVIAADSTEEALAFLAQLLSDQGSGELASYRDRVLVFDKPGVLPRLASAKQAFIPAVYSREVERELAPYAKSLHSFVIYPRNAVITAPGVVLEPASYQAFNAALEGMGKSRDEMTRLAKASGRSLTVLRRRLSSVQAVQLPEWVADPQTATKLVPFLLVGAWDSRNDADKVGLSLLAGDRPYDELEKDCQILAKFNDAPVWSIGTARGVISKLDLLFAVAHGVTEADLVRYFDVARMVLGEDDPALDFDEEQRWTAQHHGKVREFSSTFREGISETLVLLAVHGEEVFNGRFGFDIEIEVIRVIRDLLRLPLTTRVLEANDRDLPTYAEAAPDEFLSIIERDLRSDSPAVFGLLRPVSPGVFGASPSRTGLLWALEGLSWNPATLTRAASILARLAQIEIKDNWINKPAHSLGAIFSAWMPQTAANLQQRVNLLKQLATKFPDVVWRICMAELETQQRIGDYSHKPRWRADGYGYGEPLPTWQPIREFMSEVVELALNWPEFSLEMLCDLVNRLQELSDDDQARVWALVESWAKTQASDADKAVMREKIRVSTLSRRAALRAKKSGGAAALATAGKSAYDALEPSDLVNKHMWLFNNARVEESADELEDIHSSNYLEREERINRLRGEALREVFAHRGLSGILELSERGNAPWIIGSLAARVVLSESELLELLRIALEADHSGGDGARSHKSLISGAIRALIDDDQRNGILSSAATGLSEEAVVGLFLLAPFGKSTWSLVDTLSGHVQSQYWNEVSPDWVSDSESERNEAVERLLKASRPRAAFSCIRYELSKVDPRVVFRLMSEMAQGGRDLPGQYMLEPYYVEEAFKQLSKCTSLSLEQKAGLEFAYIEVLGQPWARRESSNIPYLEQYIEMHPDLYVQAICWMYKRKDGAADPAAYQVPLDRISDMAKRGYRLLEALGRLPGQDVCGDVDQLRLAKWVEAVRQSCNELSRADVADICIGKLLSRAPEGKDGVWPCESVRAVMEDIQSEPLMEGAHTGIYNSRGVHVRGDGGQQERELAEKYRDWGQALQFSYPFVASKLLMAIAKTYTHEATREDTEAGIRRRLHP
ncbi:addiction module antidote protein, HigA family [Pseudomonas sp. MYb187]|uniref:HigA family addiction module antitoxin n=1 Tax=Pseudomonas TaxID=286 RepID=UPI000CFBD8EB|nr:HigA family addiction module antitoxin [Pseudomonas sp. MYb187]PRA73027.1 addiction module antidote protein, HigA family [Pseudomonas sp. MYb187]